MLEYPIRVWGSPRVIIVSPLCNGPGPVTPVYLIDCPTPVRVRVSVIPIWYRASLFFLPSPSRRHRRRHPCTSAGRLLPCAAVRAPLSRAARTPLRAPPALLCPRAAAPPPLSPPPPTLSPPFSSLSPSTPTAPRSRPCSPASATASSRSSIPTSSHAEQRRPRPRARTPSHPAGAPRPRPTERPCSSTLRPTAPLHRTPLPPHQRSSAHCACPRAPGVGDRYPLGPLKK
jgi:hypothetical protein